MSKFMMEETTKKVDMAIYEGLIDDTDYEGYTDEKPIIPFISIRQKIVKDGDKIKKGFEDGWFCMKKTEPNIAEKLQNVTIISSGKQRAYFSPEKTLICKSEDCITNQSGELCAECPYEVNVWGKDGESPKCKEGRKLAIIWNEEPYILVFGPGSLKAWAEFEYSRKKIRLKLGKRNIPAPLHFLEMDIRAQFTQNPKGDYNEIVFENVRLISDPEKLKKMKEYHMLAVEMMPRATIESQYEDDIPF